MAIFILFPAENLLVGSNIRLFEVDVFAFNAKTSTYRRCMRMLKKKRLMGLIFFFIGIGMIIQFMMPGWGFLIAAAMVILGFWYVFVC
ncbi:MAG: hypothetical protein FWG87_03975 [Defluviitaleaceae bacterium]|nr:hypothetical protein [Defluviitaleaceae bacterium]